MSKHGAFFNRGAQPVHARKEEEAMSQQGVAVRYRVKKNFDPSLDRGVMCSTGVLAPGQELPSEFGEAAIGRLKRLGLIERVRDDG